MGQYYKALYKPVEIDTGFRTLPNGEPWVIKNTHWTGFDTYHITIGPKLMEHSYIGNLFVSTLKFAIFNCPSQVIWAGDYADKEPDSEQNMYDLIETQSLIGPDFDYETQKEVQQVLRDKLQSEIERMLYLVNETKGLYVDYSKVKEDDYHFRIDPLPLLTAEGNGRGSGDYEGRNMNLVGSWARDIIYVTDTLPEGLIELIPDFEEGDFEDEEENS